MKFCHAHHITLVMPCLPYSRQDKRAGRESCSALLLAKAIAASGAEALITVDLHANQIKGFYEALNLKPDALYATNIFLDYLHEKYDLSNMVVLAPDEGSAKRARIFAQKLFQEPEDRMDERIVYTIKDRRYDVANTCRRVTILGDVSGKDVLIADDIFDTAGTVERAILAAKCCGARSVVLCGPHSILSGPATERLDRLYKEGILKELITSDSVPQPIDFARRHPWYTQLSIAPLLAKMIDTINKEGETSSLYI
jgi:ribose-phosphate pyrophosphokinase